MANNVFVNFVKATNVFDKQTRDGKRSFKTVSVPCSDSVTGRASFSVNNGQIFQSKTDGYVNILLGAPEKEISLSVFDGESYKTVKKTAEEVRAMVNAARA